MIPAVPNFLRGKGVLEWCESIRRQLNGNIILKTYTTAERDAYTKWVDGETIFNTTTNARETFFNNSWY
jgi:hypothetical protein